MILRTLALSLLCSAALASASAQEAAAPSARDILKARLDEQAKQNPKTPAATPQRSAAAPTPASTTTTKSGATPSAENSPILATTPAPEAAPQVSDKKKSEPATVLPKVEVKKRRITVLDQQLAKQDEEIAREKKNTKPSEMDKALNDQKIAKPLAIFGGESSQFRTRVASERVALMEDEKDILEAMAHAKTKEEKAELQKQLDAIRAERRELEKALR